MTQDKTPTKAELLDDLKIIGKQVKLFGDAEIAAYSRLKAAIEAQPEAVGEPDGWQWRHRMTIRGNWSKWNDGRTPPEFNGEETEERPLYLRPSPPQAVTVPAGIDAEPWPGFDFLSDKLAAAAKDAEQIKDQHIPESKARAYCAGRASAFREAAGFLCALPPAPQQELSSSLVSQTADAAAETRPQGRGVYVASKAQHFEMWKRYRAAGQPIISTWIDEGGNGQTQDFTDLWRRCVSEAAEASAVVLYRKGDELLKGALIEIGAAMALGKPVYAVGDFDGTYHNHPLFHDCASLEEAFSRAAAPQQGWE